MAGARSAALYSCASVLSLDGGRPHSSSYTHVPCYYPLTGGRPHSGSTIGCLPNIPSMGGHPLSGSSVRRLISVDISIEAQANTNGQLASMAEIYLPEGSYQIDSD